MSKIKHSPGPWSVHRDPDSGSVMVWPPEGSGHARICTVVDGQHNEANARLIAIAPEMHDLLEATRSTVQAFLDMVNVINKHNCLPIPAIIQQAQHNCPIILGHINALLIKAEFEVGK